MLKTVDDLYSSEVFEPDSVLTYAEVRQAAGRFPLYDEVISWLESVIMKPNPGLGRAGAVCPGVHASLEQNLTKFATIRTKTATAEEAVCKCAALIDAFYALFPNQDEWSLSSLIILFPDIGRDQGADFIDGGHRRLRKIFIKNGLMLGEFHPRSTVPGVYNPAFRSMRAPVPLFAVRAISEHDYKFLLRPEFPAEERLECLVAQLNFLGGKLESRTKAVIEAAVLKLRKQCECSGNDAADIEQTVRGR